MTWLARVFPERHKQAEEKGMPICDSESASGRRTYLGEDPPSPSEELKPEAAIFQLSAPGPWRERKVNLLGNTILYDFCVAVGEYFNFKSYCRVALESAPATGSVQA